MKKRICFSPAALALLCLTLLWFAADATAQMEMLHGEFSEYRPAQHTGNQIRQLFWNDGQTGVLDTRREFISHEWPINSGKSYLGQTMIKVGAEVRDEDGAIKHIFSESMGWRPVDPTDPGSGDMAPDGTWWTFLPLPGFAHPESEFFAMSHLPYTWPLSWPDKMEDTVDPGWPGQWNGYFGKNVLNADQESYFVADDYHNREFAFYPDSTNPDRSGLGMRFTARGFQWSNALVEDIIFCLYDFKNVGTTLYDKVIFGQFAGPAVGATTQGGDNADDNGAYVLEARLVYTFDEDNLGYGGWSPVGIYGLAFLETPGNPYDGIDNDFDGQDGDGIEISEAMFAESTLQAGDPVVVIDYSSYERTVTTLPSDTLRIPHGGDELKFWPGKTIREIEHNLVDDNLNGIIDESNGSTFTASTGEQFTTYLYIGVTCVDYLGGAGVDNVMIDERRDDGIDNYGDWDLRLDDVGLDGVPFTGDYGEGDGRPTSGWQEPGVLPGVTGTPNIFGLLDTDLPGEPHIDKTDISESDMIGLTSFYLYAPWSLLPGNDDELIWQKTRPGYLDDKSQNADTDFTFASGYFPLSPGLIERFSVCNIMGEDVDDLLVNKEWADRAYTENYNFSKAPNVPTVTAITGDKKITLFWDDFAEQSVDPITGKDFEGYRIYRSTDPGWNDMKLITDGQGSVTYRKPLAQFDLINDFEGYSGVHVKGVNFWMGSNTGLVHSYADTTVKNGFTYYYAVTSYDHGDIAKGIAPTECTKYIAIDKQGKVDKGTNVVIIRPEAPAAGYTGPDSLDAVWLPGSTSDGRVGLEFINPREIRTATYQVTFNDTLIKSGSTSYPNTHSYNLIDVTNPQNPDTLIRAMELAGDQPAVHGLRMSFQNPEALELDEERTGWSRDNIYDCRIRLGRIGRDYNGIAKSSDYQVVISDSAASMSTEFANLDAVPVNFKVFNTSLQQEIAFAFDENDGDNGIFSGYTERTRSDIIYFLEKDESDSLVLTWQYELTRVGSDSATVNPSVGDVMSIIFTKPLLSHDVYQFSTEAEGVDSDLAKEEIDQIKVVPNPYIVANSWEPLNPYSSGRGPRELHFIHLPMKCSIRIFSLTGQLVDTMEHNEAFTNGTAIWDMQTKDDLDISYGIYLYHVDAGELGQKIGKFAVIK